MSLPKHRLWAATMTPRSGNEACGLACKDALAPFLKELREAALQAGWEAPEIGLALLSLAADQLKELGYGEPIN